MAGKQSPHLSGARCKVLIGGRVIGIWTSFSYSFSYDVVPAFILGRHSAASLTTVGVEPVSITAGGWRIVDHSFFNEGKCTELKDLLLQEDLTLTVVDRVTDLPVATILGCLPTGVSCDLSSKQLSTGTNTYMGLMVSTEDFTNSDPGVQLPS